ncbi:hypothetical protein LCGC14_2900140, partial [marine sediment metagenome]
MTSIREQIEALRLTYRDRGQSGTSDAWVEAWNAALEAAALVVDAVVSPVCPDTRGSKIRGGEVCGAGSERTCLRDHPCPSCQGDREALVSLDVSIRDGIDGPVVVGRLPGADREARIERAAHEL